jgi:hypothetical protein
MIGRIDAQLASTMGELLRFGQPAIRHHGAEPGEPGFGEERPGTAVLAPLLSIVVFSGVPFWPIALRKKRSSALRSRLAVNRKSTVARALSTHEVKATTCGGGG